MQSLAALQVAKNYASEGIIIRAPSDPKEKVELLRNERMSAEMRRVMEKNPMTSYFFAVSVGRLTYYDPTIQTLLEGEGYTLERIPPEEWVAEIDSCWINRIMLALYIGDLGLQYCQCPRAQACWKGLPWAFVVFILLKSGGHR